MKHRQLQLKEYSIFAAGILFKLGDAESQVVYTDIDPDIVLDEDYEFALINMDNNESFDFVFLKTSGTAYTLTSWIETYFRHLQVVGPYYEENMIAAEMTTDGSGGPTTYFPYKLPVGFYIEGVDYSYFNAPGHQLASLRGNGIGFGNFAHDTTDGYIAVKFIDEAECFHFGWIRLAVVDSCRKMIIKDYAYEIDCEKMIVTGDTIGYNGINNEPLNDFAAQVYSFDKTLYIHLPEILNQNCAMKVYSISGVEIYYSELKNENTEIKLEQQPGIYFVELRIDDKVFSKKLYLD